MTTAPVEKLIFKLALPSILSMLVTSLYNMADSFFVGKINTSAAGAIGIIFPFMAIVQSVGFFFGNGSGNYISRALGAKETKRAEKMAATGFYSALLIGSFIAILAFIFINPLIRLLGATDTIFPYAKDYLEYILMGVPFITVSFVLNNQLRFQGNAIYSMAGIVLGAILNIALDPFFIFTLNMGIAGAAVATSISQFASFIMLYIGTSKGDNIKIKFKNFTPSKEYFIAIANGGAPSLLRQGLSSFATIILNFSAGIYGDAAIAAMAIVTRIMMFAGAALIGFGQGFQPVCGFNYGAKLYSRVKRSFVFTIKVSALFLFVVSIFAYIYAPTIVSVFRDDNQVIEIGTRALRYQLLTFPFMSFVIISNMMIQTIGKVFKASLLAMLRQGFVFIPIILILPNLIGLTGVVVAQTLSDAISFLIAIPITMSVIREMDRELKHQIK